MNELGESIFDSVKMLEDTALGGVLRGPLGAADRKSCCASLYDLEPVRLLLGETLHPGGLALTHRLGKLLDIKRDASVLDVACGRGASSLAVARSFHCRVVGLDLGRRSIAEATRMASESKMDGSVSFLCGDGEALPLAAESFDAALCECSMSLFPDKRRGGAEIARLLRPGGRLAVSDVTVEPGCLPEELTGTLGQMLCLADAPSVERYRELLCGDGLSLIHQQDASDAILKLLEEVEAKLAAFRLLQSLRGRSADGPELIGRARTIMDKVKTVVREGGIGYWLFVAEKKSSASQNF